MSVSERARLIPPCSDRCAEEIQVWRDTQAGGGGREDPTFLHGRIDLTGDFRDHIPAIEDAAEHLGRHGLAQMADCGEGDLGAICVSTQ